MTLRPMSDFRSINRNFEFMRLQVIKQLERTQQLLRDPSPKLVKSIQEGDDYIDTLKSMLEDECFAFIGQSARDADERHNDTVRAINVTVGNLERIADFSANIARQTGFLDDLTLLKEFDCDAYFEAVHEGVRLVGSAMKDRDVSQGVRICRIEADLDQLYRQDFDRLVLRLRDGGPPDTLITVLFILHYLERMGDALQNIGEAIIFAEVGERLKIEQYELLDEAVASTTRSEKQPEKRIRHMELASIWGTRSGIRIGTIQTPESAGAKKVLFKEGNPEKLEQEIENLKAWRELAPDLVPDIIEYQRRGNQAALLMEFLPGATLQYHIVKTSGAAVPRAVEKLCTIVTDLWCRTKKPQRVDAKFVSQLESRLADVRRVHPDLGRRDVEIGRLHVLTLDELIRAAGEIDAVLTSPFSVFIHGDFNLDNIIYDPADDSMYFIDVHRSREMDYVQDVSVFLVSAYRVPVFEAKTRALLAKVAKQFLGCVRKFAADQGDETFEARLALGLMRSFITSTRFELDHDFARSMHQRATFLLNKIVDHQGKPWHSFKVPQSVLLD